MTWAVHVSLAPTWFDPAETSGIITPFMVLYALHDAMVRPSPGQPMAPSLAESWSVSPDGLVYEFVLRKGVQFHNGDTVSAEDVKFSFERYRGASAKPLKESVAAVETPEPGRVRIRLKRAWPDFMTFYRIQQLVYDKAMVAPIWLNAGLNGVGPRVEESGIGLITGYLFSAPYEDVKLRSK